MLGPPTDTSDVHDYNPIFWKASDFDFQDSSGFYLSETPAHWSKSWDSVCARAATWLKLVSEQTDTPFLFINTHLDHIGEKARVAGSRLILEVIDELQEATNTCRSHGRL